jgi:O-antigen/teichoic acid export membrane protein
MSLSIIKKNIIANFSGKAWTGIISLVFIPLYVKLIGIEAYGLIGIFASLTVLLSVLDMGLSATLSRELAKLSIARRGEQESRDLVRTLEFVYWGVGLMISIGLISLGPLLAHHWIRSEALPARTVQQAFMTMGLVIAFQWPVALYSGGLMGLQCQMLLNGLRVAFVTVQHVGAVLVLWLISPTVVAYFAWQIVVSMMLAFSLSYAVWKSLPVTHRKSRFQVSLLSKNWKFASGMMGIMVMSAVLTQVDKIVLSKLLSLAAFGYYMIALNLANVVLQFVNPVYSALFPRFSQLSVEHGGEAALSALYHKSCQLVSALVIPVACVLTFYSQEILFLWTHDQIIVENTHIVLSLLVVGSTINALMVLPLAIQLAYGWTKLSFFKNIIATIVLVPLMIWMAGKYGVVGAATVWIMLNAGYFFIEIPLMHRRVLRQDMRQWYARDIGAPLLVVFSIVYLSRVLMPQGGSSSFAFLWIAVTGLAALCFSSLLTPLAGLWTRKAEPV